MSNSLLSRSSKSIYPGIYEKKTKKGKAFIARYTINKKTKTQIIGYEEEGMTLYDAYNSRLQLITSLKLTIAIKTKENDLLNYCKLFLKFITSRKDYLAKNTLANYNSIYNQYIVNDFKNKDVRDVTYNNLQNYINKLLTIRKPATVDKIVSIFKKFYQYLQNEGIYRYNPAAKLIMPKYDNKKYFSITKKNLKRIVKYINNIDNILYKTLYFLLFAGRRIDETRTLQWSNIDLENKIYYLEYERTKTKKNQYYYLENFQINTLIELREKYPSTKYVFENQNTKKPITYTSFYRVHKKLRETLNMPDYKIHCIRHTVAHEIVNNGYPLEIVAKILGHADIKSSSRYAVLDMNKARNAYSKTFTNLF